MRTAGTIASPVKVLREATSVSAVPNLPQQNLQTAVVVDAMYAVRRWSFHKYDTFGAVARRYRNMPTDILTGTDIMHFCCDRYNPLSLMSLEQQHRYARSRPAIQFEIGELTQSPAHCTIVLLPISQQAGNMFSYAYAPHVKSTANLNIFYYDLVI